MRPSAASVLLLAFAAALPAQPPGRRSPIMRPLVMGRHWAAAAMHPLAVAAAEQIFQAGDAMLLVWDAKARKAVSINAAGTAPRLATIDWYKQHQGGKLPVNEGLLAGTVPGVLDAWYLLLDRWGTRSFAEVLAPAIDLAANGYPLTRNQSEEERKRFEKYPTTVRVLFPEGRALRAGELYRNPDLARTLRTLVDAEKKARRKGRHAALKAARDEFYKGSIARTMARFSEENGGLFRYQDFASYSAKVEEPVWTDYRGYRVYKNPSANQGPSELMALNILENYDLRAMGHNSAAYIHANVEALKLAFADREKYLGDQDFVQIPYERLLSKAYARERQALLDPEKASLELRPGEAPGGPLDVTFGTSGDHEGDTS
ncbi:MAG: gamma-glutamyltransferase, partial [Acidobacteria bacterium]|nr:gamma-glutamyltransferase [Acidobacteriota bacterium]